MKAYPETDSNAKESDLTNSAAYMEYKVYFTNAGSYTLDVYRMPTLNERGTMRLAVAIDDGTPTVLSGTNKYSGARRTHGQKAYCATVKSLQQRLMFLRRGIIL